MHQAQAILSLRHVQIGYQGQPPLLKGIDLDLYAGETVVLLGDSGSGKSTLGRALQGLLPRNAAISHGTIQLHNSPQNLAHASRKQWRALRGREIGYVPQDALQALNPLRRISQHFYESMRFQAQNKSIESICFPLLRLLGFTDPQRVWQAYPFQLSGGMCQRVCLALAVCQRPALIIADEPSTALDLEAQIDVITQIRRVQQQFGSACLLITHDRSIANTIADRIAVLQNGTISTSAKQLISAPRHSTAQHSPINTAPPVLHIHKLRKYYQTQAILDEIELEIRQGEILGLLGRSGSGKTTLARCILGLETPDHGELRFANIKLGTLSAAAQRQLRSNIQVIFQDARASLNPYRSALQAVIDPLDYHRLGNKRQRIAKAHSYLGMVGLPSELFAHKPKQLSTGQCQRVAIARALVLEPQLLICDEPITALDHSLQSQIIALLQRLQQQLGFSALFISHNIRAMQSLCHRIAILHQGQICETLPADQLEQQATHPYTKSLLHTLQNFEQTRISA